VLNFTLLRKNEHMKALTLCMLLLTGFGTIAMIVPAAASPTIFGSTDVLPTQATAIQYAQDFSHGSGAVDYGYKFKKKSAKSKTHTTGQAKSTKTDTAK
jgi:hypothetical protein